MPWQNLKDSAIFKISIDVVFEAVGIAQTKKIDLLKKLLCADVQPVPELPNAPLFESHVQYIMEDHL